MKISILGRCRRCVAGKRTGTYCCTTMLHTECKAECSVECLDAGYNMTKCWLELQHQEPNGTRTMSIGTTCSEHEVSYSMLNLPKCCLKLEYITVPVDVSTQDLCSCNKFSHVTGFMLECSETKWEDWFSSYYQHSNTRYSIHTGKQVNKRQEHGIIHLYEENFTFKIEWSHIRNCFHAGKGWLKSEISNPLKRRNAPAW